MPNDASCCLHSGIRGSVKKFPEFFDIDGLVHHEFVPPAQSVSVQVLQRNQRDKWQAGTVVSASRYRTEPHSTCCVITQQAHSPDLAVPCLKETRFATKEGIELMRGSNSGRFQQKPPAGASSSGRIDGASACARKGPTLEVIT
jgi:hypothetical protein